MIVAELEGSREVFGFAVRISAVERNVWTWVRTCCSESRATHA